MNSIKSLFSALAPARARPQMIVDARVFRPDQPARGETFILTAHNQAHVIGERVSELLQSAAAVIVIDQASTDGTPFCAAEAGAVVVRQGPEQSQDAAMREALRLARRMGTRIRLCGADQ